MPHRELYVYWKTRRAPDAQAAAHALQARLRAQWLGLDARLLRREPAADGRSTLMEIYRHPGGVDTALEAAIAAQAEAALAGLLDSPRMVEAFWPADDPSPG